MNSPEAAYDLAPWGVESFRLSVFHSTPGDHSGLWEHLIGSSPESKNERPREQTVQVEGPVDRNRLVLVTQTNRLDWHIAPGAPKDPSSTELVFLTDAGWASQLFHKALEVSVKQVRQVGRLAFGAVLLQPVADMEGAERVLSGYLPISGLERGVQDLLYRINRRCKSQSAPHVLVNRIATWSAELVQSGAFQIGPPDHRPIMDTRAHRVVRLILDINTSPDNNAISPDRMPPILAELLGFGQQIAVTGDAE